MNAGSKMKDEKLLDKLKWYQSMFPTSDPVLAETIIELESCYNTIDTLNRLVSELEKEINYG